MADQITTPKRLEQLFWSRGITDGDIRKGFVRRLDNVEIDRPGQLRSRDGISMQNQLNPTTGKHVVNRFNGDPSGLHSDGWLVWIDSSKIYITYWGSSAITDAGNKIIDIPSNVADIDIGTIDMVFVGSNIYITSKDNSGGFNDVIVISWAGRSKRFKSPSYIVSPMATWSTEDNEGKWVVFSLSEKPVISTFVETSLEGKVSTREGQINSAISWLDQNKELGVAIFIERHVEVPEGRSVGYENTTAVSLQYRVVFEYADGTLSSPSNSSSVSFDATLENDYDIGATIIVSKDISPNIVGVRLYRKLIEGTAPSGSPVVSSGNHDLMFTARMYTEIFDEDTYISPVFNGGAVSDFNTPSLSRSPFAETTYGYRANTGWYHLPPGWSNVLNYTNEGYNTYAGLEYTHKITKGGNDSNFEKSDGWFKPYAGSNARMYMPVHMFQTGDSLTIRPFNHLEVLESGGPLAMYPAINFNYDNPIRLTDRRALSRISDHGGWTYTYEFVDCIIKGSSVTEGILVYDSASGGTGFATPGVDIYATIPDDVMAVGINHDLEMGRGYYQKGNHLSSTYTWDGPASPAVEMYGSIAERQEGIQRAFVLHRDSGQVPQLPTLEDEFGNIDVIEKATPKPLVVGAAGGRLFMLNYTSEAIHSPSGLTYSTFLKPSVFEDANTIDYGVRDDGEGVAILTFKSYILVLHSSAAYIFDISGGSDLTWREVSSFGDVGCINKRLATMTPFGPFWCSGAHMYWLKGNRPVPISDEVKDRYKVALETATNLIYKEDLKQVWLCSGTSVLVFDIPLNAWHEHQFTDISYPNIDSTFTVGPDQYLNVTDDSRDNTRIYKLLSTGYNPTFKWGISIDSYDMGVPEITKKVKRLYLHAVPEDTSNSKQVEISGSDDGGGSVYIKDFIADGNQTKTSLSLRGFKFGVSVYILKELDSNGEELFWKGKIESLGLSYKSKNLK